MDHQNVKSSQNMNLVLSTDAKPRLKWTPQLHHVFIDAVNKLGGPEKATPKSLMRMMGIPGLTLYHLKSHLQKYRLGKNQQTEMSRELKGESVDGEDSCSLNELNLFCEGNEVNDTSEEQIQENAHITQAIQIQMEVQRKLQEQIEVQRHLQIRIEAQGKYLQKVLKKAHETLSIYNPTEIGVEHTKAKLSQLVSMVSNSTSSFSELTETQDLSLDNLDYQKSTMRNTRCSVESSLTSSERQDDERDTAKFSQESSHFILPLLDKPKPRGLRSKKRCRGTTSKGICVLETSNKKSKQECIDEMGHGLEKDGLFETFDLSSLCENNKELSLGPKQPIIDLNLKV